MQEAQEWCKMHDIHYYYETSATDGRNLPEVFETMARKALETMEKKFLETKDVDDSTDTIKIDNAPRSTKEKTCILM